MRRLLLTAALLGAACASAPPSPLQTPAAGLPQVITNEPDGGVRIITNAAGQPIGRAFRVAPDKVWPLAIDAYARVGLRIDGSDPAQRQVQTRAQQIRRKLGNVALSTYFDCGTEMTGPIADSWRLTLDGRMAVSPGATADVANVTTMLTVVARPVEGNSATSTVCSSNGRLEAAVANAIKDALATQQS